MLGGGFTYFFMFTPNLGEMIQLEHIFPTGWLNHQDRMIHSGRLTAGTYSHHPFRKENDLNQTSRELCSMLIFRGVLLPL